MLAKRILCSCVVAVALMACESSTSPLQVNTPPPVADLDVAGIAPAQNFSTTGEVSVALIPRARDGTAILSSDVAVDAELLKPACYEEDESVTEIIKTGSRPVAVALILDSSGSLAETDPARDRVDAARTFARVIWDAGDRNELALFDFGAGGESGFIWSRMLANFTRDESILDSGLQAITEADDTPLYESVIEVLDFVDQTRPQNEYRRIAVVLSDGLPNGPAADLDDAVEKATATNIPLYTIGLGTASIESMIEDQSAVQVMQQLAGRTEGKYAAADDPATLAALQGAVGTAVGEGYFNSNLSIEPVPPPGSTVRLSLSAGSQTTEVLFRAPPGGPSDEFFTWPVLPGAEDGEFQFGCLTQDVNDCYSIPSSPNSAEWYDAQPFQLEPNDGLASFDEGWHLGADWNQVGGDDRGEPVFAAANGTIARPPGNAGTGWGNAIFVRHETGFGTFTTVYAHVFFCDGNSLQQGDEVVAGQQIATVGRAEPDPDYPYHLHFELRAGGNSEIGRGYTPGPLSGVSNSARSDRECGIGPQGQINPTYFISRHNDDLRIPLYSWCGGDWEPAWSHDAQQDEVAPDDARFLEESPSGRH